MNRLKKEQRQHTHTQIGFNISKIWNPYRFSRKRVRSFTNPSGDTQTAVGFSLVQPLTGWDPGVKGMKTQAHTDLSLGETLKSGVCFTPIFWWVGKGWKQVMKPILAT